MINIYMNEFIREKKTHVPVITVEESGKGGRTVYANEVLIKDLDGNVIATVKYDPGRGPSRTHDVKAWIEVSDNVVVEVI